MDSRSGVQVANKQWLYLGCEYDRWQTLKMKCGVSTDVELLTMLLDCYIQLHMKDFEVLPVASDLFGPLEDFHESETGSKKVIKTGQEADTATTNVKSLENSRDISIEIKVDQETNAADNEQIENSIEDSCTSSVDIEARKLVAGIVANETNSEITVCEDIVIKQEPLSPSSSQDTEHREEEGSVTQQQDDNNRRNSAMAEDDDGVPVDPMDGSVFEVSFKQEIETTAAQLMFECAVCDKKYKTKYSLKRHLKVHDEGYHFSCKSCAKYFDTHELFQRHVEQARSKTHLCNQCGKCCKTKGSLQEHMKRFHSENTVHRNAKIHVCPL